MSDYAELAARCRAAVRDDRLSTGALYRDAADAIEALYAEVKMLARKTDEIIGESMSDGQALMAEISDLKGENERLKFLVESTRQSVRATAESNARLRADLDIARLERQIADSANERLREELAAAQRDAKRWHMANRLRLVTAQHIDAAIREEAQR